MEVPLPLRSVKGFHYQRSMSASFPVEKANKEMSLQATNSQTQQSVCRHVWFVKLFAQWNCILDAASFFPREATMQIASALSEALSGMIQDNLNESLVKMVRDSSKC